MWRIVGRSLALDGSRDGGECGIDYGRSSRSLTTCFTASNGIQVLDLQFLGHLNGVDVDVGMLECSCNAARTCSIDPLVQVVLDSSGIKFTRHYSSARNLRNAFTTTKDYSILLDIIIQACCKLSI